jgi:hypothetical protein
MTEKDKKNKGTGIRTKGVRTSERKKLLKVSIRRKLKQGKRLSNRQQRKFTRMARTQKHLETIEQTRKSANQQAQETLKAAKSERAEQMLAQAEALANSPQAIREKAEAQGFLKTNGRWRKNGKFASKEEIESLGLDNI